MRSPSFIGIGALALCAVCAPGAAADEAEAGTRVRVMRKGSSQPVTGRLVARSPDWLSVETHSEPNAVRIPFDTVARLQVSDGRARGTSAAVGALVGLAAGTLLYVASPGDCTGSGCAGRFALFAGPAALVGGLAGARIAPERWRTVDRVPDVTSLDRSRRIRVVLRPAPGGVSATAALAF